MGLEDWVEPTLQELSDLRTSVPCAQCVEPPLQRFDFPDIRFVLVSPAGHSLLRQRQYKTR